MAVRLWEAAPALWAPVASSSHWAVMGTLITSVMTERSQKHKVDLDEEGARGPSDPELKGWSAQQRLLTMAWLGAFVSFPEEGM